MRELAHADVRAILKVLKRTLKARNYTYARVARELELSEITVKRIFSGTSASLKNILAICDLLNVGFLELAAIARETDSLEYVLSESQDRFFSKNPVYYAIFIDLYRRTPAIEVKKYWNLNDAKFHQILRNLEKIGLLEVLPKGKCRFHVSGTIRVPINGLLSKVFFKHNLEFLHFAQNRAGSPVQLLQTSEVLLSKEHSEEFMKEVLALGKKIRDQAFVDETVLAKEKRFSTRWLFVAAPYETDWRKLTP